MVTRVTRILGSMVLVLLLLSSCEVRDWKNPYDSGNFIGVKSPVNLEISQVDVHTVALSWEEQQSHIAGYKIDRKLGEDGEWVIGYGETDTTAWQDTAARTVGVNYYRVYAYADENESLPLVTSINPSFPTPADFWVTQVTDTDVRLIWRDVSKGEDGFRIDRKIGENRWQEWYGTAEANAEAWTDTAALLDTSLTYRIYGYAGDNLSGEETKDITPTFPAPQELIVEVVDDYRLRLHWHDDYDYEAGFRIFRRIEDGDFEPLADVAENTKTYLDSNLTVGTDYIYRVHAFTESNLSHPAISTPKQTYLPPPEEIEAASNNPDSVRVVWEPVDLPYLTGYQVERKTAGGTYTVLANTTELHYTDTGLNQGEEYTYRVRSVTSHNVSHPSANRTVEWGEYYRQAWSGSQSNHVISVALSPDQNWVASGGQDRMVTLWNRSSGSTAWSGSHSGTVSALQFDPNSQSLFSGGYNGQVISWNVSTGAQIWNGQISGAVRSIDVADDNTKIVTGGQDNSVKAWDVASGAELWTGTHSDEVRKVQFSADGTQVVSVGSDGLVKMWDATTGAELWSTDVGGAVHDVDMDANQTRVVAGGANGIHVLAYDTGAEQWTAPVGSITGVAIDASGTTVLAAGSENYFTARSLSTGDQFWSTGENSVTTLVAAENASRAFTGNDQGKVTAWNTDTGAPIWSDFHADKVWTVTTADDASWIASGGYDNQVRCWEKKLGWITTQNVE